MLFFVHTLVLVPPFFFVLRCIYVGGLFVDFLMVHVLVCVGGGVGDNLAVGRFAMQTLTSHCVCLFRFRLSVRQARLASLIRRGTSRKATASTVVWPNHKTRKTRLFLQVRNRQARPPPPWLFFCPSGGMSSSPSDRKGLRNNFEYFCVRGFCTQSGIFDVLVVHFPMVERHEDSTALGIHYCLF